MTAAAGVLSTDRVSFAYPDGVKAIEDVSLCFPRGSVTGIIGPSGCGKSTLLHLMSGLIKPDGGTVSAAGPGTQKDGHRIAMVFQKDTLLPWTSVLDNVALYGRFNRSERHRTRERGRELLDDLGLGDFADRYPDQLSGGMRRRVAFLAGVVAQPDVLLLDEPFSSVDEPTRVSIHQDVHRIISETNMTAVLVTHDLAEAVSLSDRVVILTRRPARVAQVVEVPFGADRDMRTLRQRDEFLGLYGMLWALLQDQTEAADEPKEAQG